MQNANSWCCTLLILLSCFGKVLAVPQPTCIPIQISHSLDSLKKQNQLAEWIYARIDYSAAVPKERLIFLMDTQKESWRKPKSAAEKEAWLSLLNNQAYQQLYFGNILQSINSYELAYNYWLENNINADITEYILKPWANNYTRLGDYEKAIFIQQKTLDFAIKEKNQNLIASTNNNLAISYRSLGDFEKALNCIEQGLKNIKQTSPISILLNNTLADVYKEQHKLDLAETIIFKNIEKQIHSKQDAETAYWLLSSYITAGDIQLEKKQFSKAKTWYLAGLNTNHKYYKGDRLREQAYIQIQLGKINLAQQKPMEALNNFNSTLQSLGIMHGAIIDQQHIFGDNRLIETFYQRALAYLQLNNPEAALQQVRLALITADKIRFELADIKTKQRFQAQTRQMSEKAISIAFNLLEKTGKHHYAAVILSIFEQSKARTLLDNIRRNRQQLTLKIKDPLFQQKINLERAIAYHEKTLLQHTTATSDLEKTTATLRFKLEYVEKQLNTRYPSLDIKSEIPLYNKDLLKKLPETAHLISFFSGEEYLYAIEISNRAVKHIHRVSQGSQLKKDIATFANTYYHNGPDAMLNNPEQFFTEAQQIQQTLLGSFHFAAAEQVIIVPDETIGYLSFEGLIGDGPYSPVIASWPFLIRKLTFAYAFSIQTWLNQSKAITVNNKVQDFAGLFLTHQNQQRSYIPAAANEAKALKKIICGKFMIDDAAIAKNFFDAFDHADVLHISTHAYLSGIQQEPTLAFQDQQVFLFELSARKKVPSLVVLSACKTAGGQMSSGEGIISLNRGFAAIGTRGTIASLWNVNDEAAAAVTINTYEQLLTGQNVNAALHQAKLKWLNQQNRPAQEYLPYYWDALIFTGYDQKINLPHKGRFTVMLFAATGLLTIIAAFAVYFKLKK